MPELARMMSALQAAGVQAASLTGRNTAYVVAESQSVLAQNCIPGVAVEAYEGPDAMRVRVRVAPGASPQEPVHLCFGMLGTAGEQRIQMEISIGEGASARFLAHCLFPHVETALHAMDAVVSLEAGARARFSEAHYHGRHGEIRVTRRIRAHVGESSSYVADFALTRGLVGRLSIDHLVDVQSRGAAELTTRVFGHQQDRISIREEVHLEGKASRSVVTSRVALDQRQLLLPVSDNHFCRPAGDLTQEARRDPGGPRGHRRGSQPCG